MKLVFAISLAALALVGCDKKTEPVPASQAASSSAQCFKDTDCKGERICESGKCVSAQEAPGLNQRPAATLAPQSAPEAPRMSYVPLIISGDDIGGTFTTSIREMGGSAINYVSRAGVVNVMDYVVEDPDLTGYVTVEKAYAFGGKYLLVVSTGESGMSCPATTYAFTFDSATESVTGKAAIDGCSEMVESLADGNKLIVKKDGAQSVFYNGDVK
nr:hypothetical protein FFPRI1PSEUD_40120 [Pseudomonas sp. FFPRI_1]